MPEAVSYLVCALLIGAGAFAMIPLPPRRTPRPAAARLHSLVTHGIFGFGLYAAGWVTSLLYA
ncbi:MAG: DUF2938 family protein [Gammaproteobacteria bacterium]